jgi:hypothetical protein
MRSATRHPGPGARGLRECRPLPQLTQIPCSGQQPLPRIAVSILPTNHRTLAQNDWRVPGIHAPVPEHSPPGATTWKKILRLAGGNVSQRESGPEQLWVVRPMLGVGDCRATVQTSISAVQVHIAPATSPVLRAATPHEKCFEMDRVLLEGLISDHEPNVATGRQRPNTSCKQLANLLQLRPPNRRLPSAHIAFVCGC